MTANQILNPYPECRVAVAYTELFLCSKEPDEDKSAWETMMSAPTPMNLDEVIEMIQDVLKSEVEEKSEGRPAQALEQSYHPSYRTYIAGKMGMM